LEWLKKIDPPSQLSAQVPQPKGVALKAPIATPGPKRKAAEPANDAIEPRSEKPDQGWMGWP